MRLQINTNVTEKEGPFSPRAKTEHFDTIFLQRFFFKKVGREHRLTFSCLDIPTSDLPAPQLSLAQIMSDMPPSLNPETLHVLSCTHPCLQAYRGLKDKLGIYPAIMCNWQLLLTAVLEASATLAPPSLQPWFSGPNEEVRKK